MFYLIVFLILSVLAVLDMQITAPNSKRVLLFLSAAILTLIAGLRVETGGDWDNYAGIYRDCPSLLQVFHTPTILFTQQVEAGYVLLCSILKSFGAGMQWVLLIVATTNISLIAVSLKRYTLYPVLGLVCYYCILYFSLEMIYIRQATAVALCFYALRYVQEKKVWKYMLLVIVACLFHRIAIVMIPFYWLLDRSYNIWAYITIMAVGIVVMAIGILWFKPVFLNMSSLLGEGFYNKALEYATSDRFAVSRTISIGFYLNALIFAAVMLFKKEIEQLPYGKIQLNMFCLSLLMYYYGYELIEVSNRVRLFFLIGIIALLPMLLQVLQTNMSKLIATVPILLYCFSFSMHIFTEQPRAIAYNPYQNCIVMGITGQKSTGAKRLQQSKQHFDKERKR